MSLAKEARRQFRIACDLFDAMGAHLRKVFRKIDVHSRRSLRERYGR